MDRALEGMAIVAMAVGVVGVITILVAMAVELVGGDSSAFARDYCAEHGAIAVGQYCLTEAEIVLRRVPERF